VGSKIIESVQESDISAERWNPWKKDCVDVQVLGVNKLPLRKVGGRVEHDMRLEGFSGPESWRSIPRQGCRMSCAFQFIQF
jgi:hypothetical protein